MFGFSMHEMETTGSAERFPVRVEKFRKKKKFIPVAQHYVWWFIHNCITHPLIGLIPIKPFFEFHDWTSIKLNVGEAAITMDIDDIIACEKQLLTMRDKLREINTREDLKCLDAVERAYFAVHNDIVQIRRELKKTKKNK